MPTKPAKSAARFDANQFKPRVEPAASRLALRERTKKRRSLQQELVTIDLGDEVLEYLVKAPASGVRWELEQFGFDPETDKILPTAAFPALIIGTVCDPESGEHLYSQDERDREREEAEIRDLDPEISTPLVRAALRIVFPSSKAKPEGDEGGAGNSSGAPEAAGSDAASPSPTS